MPGARAGAGAPGEEGLQLGLEALGLIGGVGRRGQGRVDGGVQHHGPDVGGEERGVGGPEQCAVRVAHEREPGIAQCGPDPVEVTGGVDRAHVGQDAAAVLLALGGEALVVVEQGLLGGRGGGHRVDELAARARGRRAGARRVALHRTAPLHPAGVERDDVESIEHLGGEHRQFVGQIVDTRASGASGVDDQ